MNAIVKILVSALVLFLTITNICSGQSLPAEVEKLRQKYDLAGGVLVIFNQKEVQHRIPFGYSDIQRNIPVTDSTVFRIASISKTITTLALFQLVEQGKISVDQDISDILGYEVRNPYFPEIALTPAMLLSHTSSLNEEDAYDNFLGLTYTGNPIPDISELINKNGKYYTPKQFLVQKPGTYFSYSNLGYGITGTLIEKVSGKRFDVFCRENIFIPLGIDASYNVNDFQNFDKISVLYRKKDGNWIPQADNYVGEKTLPPNLESFKPGTNGLRFGAQGGLRISGSDLAEIFRIFLNKGKSNEIRIVKNRTIKKMLKPQWVFNGENASDNEGFFRSWGLGIQRITEKPLSEKLLKHSEFMAGHSGDAYGLISNAFIDPKRKIGFVMIVNGAGSGYNHVPSSTYIPFEREFFELVEKYLLKK
jgi:CubicO group peptidase (beta-lactamase class C family)